MRTQLTKYVVILSISCSTLFAEQGYDDGQAEHYFGVWSPSSGACVQITPEAYPCAPTNIRLYSDAMPTAGEVIVAVWDDNGPAGSPGTMFDAMRVPLDPTDTPGWIDIDIASLLAYIEQDSFYAGFAGSGWTMYSNGIDTSGPQYERSWRYHTDCVGRKSWYPFGTDGNLMVRVDYSYSRPDGPVENITVSKKYKHITHAILDAESGDEIVLDPGIYKENIDFAGKNLVLRSREPDDPQVVAATVLKGRSGGPVVSFTNGEDYQSKLCGLTIARGSTGIFCHNVCPQIINCRIEQNSATGVEIWGISRRRRVGPSLINCAISNNGASGVQADRHATLINCEIIGNIEYGILYGDVVVTNCTIVGNGQHGMYCGLPRVTNSIIWGNQTGGIECYMDGAIVNYCNIQGGFAGTGNIDSDPCFVTSGGGQNYAPPGDTDPAENDANLVGWWRFDEGDSNVAHDSSGRENHGTLSTTASWVPTGGGGYALDFFKARVLVPDANELRPSDEVSISAWVNFPLPQDGFNRVVVKGADNAETYSMEIEADHLVFSLREDQSRYSVWGWHDIDHNEWVHVAGTYDGSIQSCYINGELQDSSHLGSIMLSQDTEGLGIGNAPDVSRPFLGMIDDVRIYNTGLTDDEVIGLCNSGKVRYNLPIFDYGGDYHLAADSPCIDAGSNNCLPPDIADLDSDGNTIEPSPCDLDYLCRCVDHPLVADTGSGTGPIVDMGAYEAFLPPLEVSLRFTPEALNPASQGNWLKAHLLLPEGLAVEDVNIAVPIILQPHGIQADSVKLFKRSGLVEIQADFDRQAFCSAGPFDGTVSVEGMLTSGQAFTGTDHIKITTNSFERVRTLADFWLRADCRAPDFCGGADANRDSIVNFKDLAYLDTCCIETDLP